MRRVAHAEPDGEVRPVLRVQQRCVGLKGPQERLPRYLRARPGFGVAGRDLSAVGEAGLRGRGGLAVDDGDFVALLAKEIGRGDAEQAGAEDDDVHEGLSKDEGAANDVKRSLAAPPVLGT